MVFERFDGEFFELFGSHVLKKCCFLRESVEEKGSLLEIFGLRKWYAVAVKFVG